MESPPILSLKTTTHHILQISDKDLYVNQSVRIKNNPSALSLRLLSLNIPKHRAQVRSVQNNKLVL